MDDNRNSMERLSLELLKLLDNKEFDPKDDLTLTLQKY